MKSYKLKDIVKITGGETVNCGGDTELTGVNTIQDAGKGDITFLANDKYKSNIAGCKAECVIVSDQSVIKTDAPLLKVKDPVKVFRKVVELIRGKIKHPISGISAKALLADGVVTGENVAIGDNVKVESGVSIGKGSILYPGVYVGEDVKIGKNCLLYPNVSVLRSVELGDNVIIHSGSVIGSDGFGYSTEDGRHIKMRQIGKVIIDDNVEIGANVAIDRGSPGNTQIGEGTKIDNLVQIAHNVKIGKRCLIVSQVGIAGSTEIEDYAVLAGQAGVVGHIKIGRAAQVGAQAGVTRNVKAGQKVSGYPATEHRVARKLNVLIRRLPDLYEQVKKLNKNSKK
ncbi:MAG: UDP-3-O-(3-hydroxymyristoyl)glucosamine N-acyltransferase [Elusimicrobia bacterium]|jgi:UDP-3-O-[3-hydroxymyristoyl] glucosamine N-acyltransferase|nr:UDP-3-O-(3-hydroxymyristoyl)glucosamine N-acyltransferase [Elusimicrobiota bacterium]